MFYLRNDERTERALWSIINSTIIRKIVDISKSSIANAFSWTVIR
jgi:hypothetical protein